MIEGRGMILLVHGGAGGKAPGDDALQKISEALSVGYRVLERGGPSLEAVVAAIAVLEDSGIFNAGAGGKVQLDGVRRLDASLMEGKLLKAGAVIGLEGIRNPVKAARLAMDLPNIMFTHRGAKRIADAEGLAPLRRPGRRALDEVAQIKQEKKYIARLFTKYFSTVGAVGLDRSGTLAAGASTGGISGMLPGRVGDTPIIGAGVYAENESGAVSCTGIGESIIRRALAKEICMYLKTMPLHRAVNRALRDLLAIEGEAGVIVINRKGRFTLAHTTDYMASGYAAQGKIVVQKAFKKINATGRGIRPRGR